MKRVSVFVLALLIVILISTIAWAVLKDSGKSTPHSQTPTPGAGSQMPAPQDPGPYVRDEVIDGLFDGAETLAHISVGAMLGT